MTISVRRKTSSEDLKTVFIYILRYFNIYYFNIQSGDLQYRNCDIFILQRGHTRHFRKFSVKSSDRFKARICGYACDGLFGFVYQLIARFWNTVVVDVTFVRKPRFCFELFGKIRIVVFQRLRKRFQRTIGVVIFCNKEKNKPYYFLKKRPCFTKRRWLGSTCLYGWIFRV